VTLQAALRVSTAHLSYRSKQAPQRADRWGSRPSRLCAAL